LDNLPLKVELEDIEHYLALLAETPHRIAAGMVGMDDARLRTPPEEGEWSLVQVLAHLRSAAEVWGDNIEQMLRLDQPVVTYIHPNKRMKAAGYAALEFHTSFDAFCRQRVELLGKLANLLPEDWSRSAVIRGRTHTVFSETRRMALHEADHWAQIDRLYKV
jgi:hypothetical protein